MHLLIYLFILKVKVIFVNYYILYIYNRTYKYTAMEINDAWDKLYFAYIENP